MLKRVIVPAVLAAALAATLPSPAANHIVSVQTDQGPAALAVHPATGVVYVGNVTDGTVSVVVGAAVARKIEVPNPVGVAVDGSANRLYVSSLDAQKVFVFSTVSLAKVGEYNLGGRPWGIDIDQATGRVYVANFETDVLHVIERDSTAASAVALPACDGAVGVAHNAATSRTFVSCLYSGTVEAVSGSLSVMPSVSFGLGTYPWGVASHPSSATVYVSKWEGGGAAAGSVAVLDADTRAVIATSPVAGAPVGLAVSRGGTPYVALSAVNKLGILNPSSGALEETVDLPADPVDGMNEPLAVAVSPAGSIVYVGNYHAESVSVVSGLPRG